jgi:mono/diheme cytochrome c family protein
LGDAKYNNYLVTRTALVIAMTALGALAGCSSQSSGPGRALTAHEQRGQRLFQSTCARCHRADSTAPLNGPGMQGVFKRAYLPSGRPANDETVVQTVKTGRNNMPGLGLTLDDEQIADIIAYLKTL